MTVRTVRELKEFLEDIPDDVQVYSRPDWVNAFDIIPVKGFATVELLGTGKITHITLEHQGWDRE